MASKQIRDEIMRMTIVVNSDKGQQEIYNLKKANDALASSTADLEKKKAALGRRNKANSDEFDKLTQEIKQNNASIDANKDKMEKLRGELDLTQMTMGQLRKEAELLKRQLKEVIPGTEPAKQLQAELDKVNARMGIVKKGAEDSALSFKNLSERFNHYSGMMTAFVAILVGFGVSVQAIIDRNNKMADAMSGIEKTTGMARKEVEELTRSFSDFDTRTSKLDLMKIAEVGGRLGIAKADIADFTREVDKAYVALGDSWSGGVDALADSLGKIASLYSETRDLPIADSINMIGSALNELAAQGSSSEQNIADFVTRLGSLPTASKPALNTLLGFGSAFEEFGINSEIASSGFGKFIRVASNNAEGFAKVMRRPVQEVKDLINTDPAEFFLQFSDGLKGLEGTDLQNVLDKLKLSDNEVQRVIGAATANTDRFRDSVEIANQAVEEGTSLQNEFNKVNNNTAAIYEKIQKRIGDVFVSKTIADFINTSVTLFGQFIGVVEDANGAITKYRNFLLVLVKIVAITTATFIGMNVVTGVYNGLMKTAIERVLGLTVVEKARQIVTGLGNGINTLYTAGLALMGYAYAKVAKDTAQATFALRGFSAALTANPIGAVVTLVFLAASAYYLLSDSVDESADSLENQAKQMSFTGEVSKRVMDEQAKSVGDFKSKIDPLIMVLKDEHSSLQDRKNAYNELIKISPSFQGTLDAEFRATSRLDAIYSSLVNKIKDAAKARALQGMLDEQYEKREKIQGSADLANEAKDKQSPSTDVTIPGSTIKLKNSYTQDPGSAGKIELISKIAEDANKKLEEVDGNINSLSKKIADLTVKNSDYDTSDPDDEKAAKKLEKERLAAERKAQILAERHQKEMDRLKADGEKAAELARQIELDTTDAIVEAMDEGFEKEMSQLFIQEERKKAELDKKKIGKSEFDILQRKIDAAKGEDKALFEALKQSWTSNNQALEDEKEAQAQVFAMKRKTITAKYQNEDLKTQEDDFQEKLKRLKRLQNEELGTYENLEQLKEGLKGRVSDKELKEIKTWEEGKKKLGKVYQQQELEMLTTHLQEMVSMYEGLDMSILSEKQKKEVTKRLEEVRDKVAEVASKKQDLANGDDDKGKKLGKSKKKGKTDILGMSTDDWKDFYDNIKNGENVIESLTAAVGLLQNAFGQYYALVQAKEQAKIVQVERGARIEETRLKAKLDRGQINQEQYDAAIQKLNEETDRKKATLEYEAAKRQRKVQIGQAIVSTAMAVLNALNTQPFFPLGLAMGAVATAAGALQLATIMATPLPEAPGYEQGFGMEYDMRREQDGKKFRVQRKPLKSGEVYRPTHFIAGEKGTELVIDSPTYSRFRPEVKNILRNEIASSRGFEGGYYPYLENNSVSNSGSTSPSVSTPDNSTMTGVIERNTEALNKVAGTKFRAYLVKDMDTAKDIIDVTEEYNSYKNSARK
ncbi:phage tail tape measure protein [Chryseobacterium sp. FH1]|uniref:phage tail tape measure protein n=1 Tax=Chryseobacterium sp. FH1 TaxID=1233951 RepID=UPI0004E2C342|nr:phage tail tape measure protein [Chryseobacterium sp. FH1]KFC19385.1 hypothetical protein IO90_08790 [Chryseobacterium sp. FH1]